jgi:hypothetical protein
VKRYLIMAVLAGLLTVCSSSYGQMTDGQKLLMFQAVGTETLVVGTGTVTQFGTDSYTTNQGYSSRSGTMTHRARFTVEDNTVRYWYNGADPSATDGHMGKAGDDIQIIGHSNIANFRVMVGTNSAGGSIADGTTAYIVVTFEKVMPQRQ